MDNNDKIKKYQSNIIKNVDKIYENLVFPDVFLEATKSNKNLRYQIDKTEYKKFDEDWIVRIESFFPSLDQITRNIRNTLRYEGEILPVERTRRTSNESIRHLLRNTRYIKDVNDDNDVIPSKVLNTVSEIEYGTYENRFIMTLIDRLYNYLQRRLDAINEHIHGFKQTEFRLANEFKIGDANYKINFELNAKENFDSKNIDGHNLRILERTSEAFKVVSQMYHSQFMRTMGRYKKVNPPILKTQIILKNPDFRNAYTLWLYLDELNVLDFKLQLRSEQKQFNNTYLNQIDKSLMLLFSTVFVNSDLEKTLDESLSKKFKLITPDKPAIFKYAQALNVEVPPIELEPNLPTQYHLEKLKNSFGRKEETKVAINNSKDNQDYFKQVLLDQYMIADNLFNSYFNLDQDQDVFDKLITYKHPVRQYEEANNRYLIVKAARQVKEELYSNAVDLEAKWLSELMYLQENAINTLIESGEKEDLKTIENMKKALNQELRELNKQEVELTKKRLKEQRILNNKYFKDLTNKHKQEVKAYRDAQNKRMKAEKAKIVAKRKVEIKAIKEKQKLKREADRKKLQLIKQNRTKKLQEQKTKNKQQIRTKVTKSVANERNKSVVAKQKARNES